MSILIGIYLLAVIVATFLAALLWRPLGAALILAGLTAATLAAPFVYFGVWSLLGGVPLHDTFGRVHIVLPSLFLLLRYTVLWSVIGLVSGTALRAGWALFRRKVV